MVPVLICVGLLLTCVAPQLTSSLSLVQEDWVDKAAGVITERIGRYAAHEIKFNLMAVCRWALCVWWGWGCRWGWRWAGDVESTQRQPAYVQEVRWQACMQAGSYAGWQLPAPRGGCSPGSCRGIRQGGVGRLTCPFPSPISWRGLPAGIITQSASHFCPPLQEAHGPALGDESDRAAQPPLLTHSAHLPLPPAHLPGRNRKDLLHEEVERQRRLQARIQAKLDKSAAPQVGAWGWCLGCACGCAIPCWWQGGAWGVGEHVHVGGWGAP